MSAVKNSGGVSFSDRAEEVGATKLWSVYVDEAERYDKSLVASWKSDMEGMLIFAGLFSASLTAFLIESYKTLVQDPGDATVQLLEQILAVSSNNSTFTPTSREAFKPTTSSLVCNALWFISLGLSLACALVATLLEQWARDFLHRANMRSSPVVRARIYSYLYYGFRRFKMHAVVEIIPSLLHAALLFFFCGLVVFLLPVNKIIAALVAGILVIVLSFYTFLTILPMLQSDSPYRTPFSNSIWGFLGFCHLWFWRLLRHPQSRAQTTLVDNMIKHAVTPSADRHERDVAALLWTVGSLSDDNELQAFVEGIPDAIWGPEKQHSNNVALMTRLRDSTEANLSLRITELWRSREDGFLSSDVAETRGVACLKAFWALCSIPAPIKFPSVLEAIPSDFDPLDLWAIYPTYMPGDSSLYVSIRTMASWSGLKWLETYLTHAKCGNGTMLSYYAPVYRYLSRFLRLSPTEISQAIETLQSSVNSAQQFETALGQLLSSLAHRLFFRYLKMAVFSESLPYRWWETLNIVYPVGLRSHISNDSDTLEQLESLIDTTLFDLKFRPRRQPEPKLWNGPAIQAAMSELCKLWRPQQERQIPLGVIAYVKRLSEEPHSPDADVLVFGAGRLFYETGLHHYLWRCFPATIIWLQVCAVEPLKVYTEAQVALHDTLIIIWTIVDLTTESVGVDRLQLPDKAILDALIDALETCTSPMAPAVMLVVRAVSLWDQINTMIARMWRRRVNDPQAQSSDTAGKLEDVVVILSEFLERCTTVDISHTLRAVKSLHKIAHLQPYYPNDSDDLAVQSVHQTRFTRGLRELMGTSRVSAEHSQLVARRVLDSPVFDPPAGLERFHWITELTAQDDLDVVRGGLAEYQDGEQLEESSG
ncbi:hypothetical protein MIND_01217200 [Mycena indigotica]|uniref:DUF6535 domain-containing protein n=1 Tax=Mycena indigotica TaxID=2126181 RepID=A0A8H6VVS1_9AGAR|nr:uncharacterized protein MIND_01217200 [Mycena indigotica]KAF7291918.1 hypothetical protein MIND_01217200 [Mycena indigotica]